MAAKETTSKEVGEMLVHIVEHMARKEDMASVTAEIADVRKELKGDIAKLAEQVAGIEGELRAIRREIDEVEENVWNFTGFRKEIDHALERIAAIEKPLGMDKKVAA